jgi:hypothetical protein
MSFNKHYLINFSNMQNAKITTEEKALELVQSLTPGQSRLVSIRKVEGGKFHLEIAEKIVKESGTVNVLSLLNVGDERFNSGGARRAWAPAMEGTLTQYFGIEADKLPKEVGQKIYVDLLNPMLGSVQLRIQIKETIEGTEWQEENIERAAKRAGKDGEILTFEGLPIFSNTAVVGAEKGAKVKHTYLVSDQEEERNAEKVMSGDSPFESDEPSLD